MRPVYDFFGGRCTFFAFWFVFNGTILAYFGKPLMGYVALVAPIQALLFAHSVKEDWFAAKNGNGKNGITIPGIATSPNVANSQVKTSQS